LACEDEERIVELLRTLSEPLGVELVAARDGAAAVAHLSGRRPALIILDLVLPNLDGFAVLERIRQRKDLDDVPVMVLSALADSAAVKRAYELGVVDYVQKPFNVDVLEAKLRVYLKLHHLSEERRDLHARSRDAELLSWAKSFAHEVRNPLSAIGAAAQVIAHQQCNDSQRIRLSRAIEGEAARIALLVQEYVERREARASMQSVDVPGLLTEVVEVNLLSSPARDRIRIDADETLPPARADAARLKQVILNLVLNAAKATEAGGAISVSARREAGGVALRVTDTGCGIEADHLTKIFDETFSTWQGGGLGLSIARKLVEQHGGRLLVESSRGTGTTFTVWLPAA
jgi:signal transduction histidine kinase